MPDGYLSHDHRPSRDRDHDIKRHGRPDENRNYDRGYGRDYDRDRSFLAGDRPGYRNDHSDHTSGDRSRDEGQSFWTQMKDEARSWFGNDDDEHRDTRERSDWSNRASYGGNSSPRHERDRRFEHRGQSEDSSWREPRFQRGDSRRDRHDRSGDRNFGRESGRRDPDMREPGSDGNRSPDGYLIVEEYAITAPSASQDDHYRNWRSEQMKQLDSDYQDYCREREHQFHRDFDEWRRNRSGNSQSNAAGQKSENDHNRSETSSIKTSSSGSGSETATAKSANGAPGGAASKTDTKGGDEGKGSPSTKHTEGSGTSR